MSNRIVCAECAPTTAVNAARADRRASGDSRDVFLAMYIYRLGHRTAIRLRSSPNRRVDRLTLRLLTTVQKLLVYYPLKLELPFAAHIGTGLRLPHPHNIVLNSRVAIGDGCTIFHGVTLGESLSEGRLCPTIEDDVSIGAGAIIIGDVMIGRGAIVGAGSVVTKSVAAGQTVVGINRLVGKRVGT